MRVRIVAAGRWRRGPEQALYESYAKRLPWPLDLVEIDVRRRLPPERLKAAEAEQMRAALPQGAAVIALDGTGRDLSSPDLAGRLRAWQDRGIRDLAFLIGGADGLDRSLTESADLVLALGRATWPHLLVRTLLAEQLYRAHSIMTGHPYHRE